MNDILFYTHADRNIGCGHIKRDIVLAEEFIGRGYRIGFEVPDKTIATELLSRFRFEIPINDYNHIYSTIIIDLMNGPSRELLLQARSKFKNVIVIGGVGFPIEDQASVDELVDLQIIQSISVPPQASNVIGGLNHLIIHPDYLAARKIYSSLLASDTLVVMGGGDPHDLTSAVCSKALASGAGNVRAVFGPASSMTPTPRGVRVSAGLESLVSPLASSRICISAMGMTTYEAACVGVPTASICWSQDHSETADALEAMDVTCNLGAWDNPNWEKLDEWITKMSDKNYWALASYNGRLAVDGLGVGRVADRIEAML